jgi:hypothetical protein
MYRVDFISSSSYQTLHSLRFVDGLDNIKLNAEKIAGSSYFAKEPRRVEFECLNDSWINDNILSGTYEFEKYISMFFIKLFEHDTCIFTGIIDCSFVNHDSKTDIVRFTCYDFIRLLSKYSDLKTIYSLVQGYHPGYIFGIFMQSIENRLGISVSHTWSHGWTPSNIQKENLVLIQIPWRKVLRTFRNWNGDLIVKSGFRILTGNIPEFKLLIYKEHVDNGDTQFKVYARTYRFYNNICILQITDSDVDEKSGRIPTSNTEELDSTKNEIMADYLDTDTWDHLGILYQNGNTYSFNIPESDIVNGYESWQSVSEHLDVTFTGNVIAYNIHPKGFYNAGGESTEQLKVVKAILMLHNLTIISQPSGNIRLINKNDANNNLIVVEKADIIEFKRKRINRTVPDTSTLDCLIGDLNLLKNILSDSYISILSQIWELTSTIDNLQKYNISLFDRIQIEDKQYKVTELQRDTKENEYKLKAWELPNV